MQTNKVNNMQHITVVSVKQASNDSNTIVLTDGAQTIQVEGVVYDAYTDTPTGSARINPLLTTQKHLCTLFNNWVWEEANGEGAAWETITLL